MKTKKVIILAAFLTLFGYANIFAQQPQQPMQKQGKDFQKEQVCPRGGEFMKDLTDAQKEQMKTFQLELVKQSTPLKSELKVLKAQLDQASIGDNVSTKEVNSLIDKITKTKGDLMKLKYANKQKVRSILTEEQKVMFDAQENGPRGMENGRKGNCSGSKGMKSNKSKCDQKCMKS